MSNTALSLKLLRDAGYHAAVCEKWVPFYGSKAPVVPALPLPDWIINADERGQELLIRLDDGDDDALRESLLASLWNDHGMDLVRKIEQQAATIERLQKGEKSGGVRKDLFGFMDILAYTRETQLAVQCTTKQQIAKHIRDYRRNPEVRHKIWDWITGGVPRRHFHIHGWHQPKGKGTRWQVEERVITAADLDLTAADRAAEEKGK